MSSLYDSGMEAALSWILSKFFYVVIWFVMDPVGRVTFVAVESLLLLTCFLYFFGGCRCRINSYKHEKMAFTKRSSDPGVQTTGAAGKDEGTP